MNSEAQWDATRWRDAHRTSLGHGPPLSAPVPRDTGRAHSILVGQDQRPWESTSFRPINVDKQGSELVSHPDARHPADASGSSAWSPRHYLPPGEGPLREPSVDSPRARPAQAWQYKDFSRRSSITNRSTDPPLTLQIPGHYDPPRVLPSLAGSLGHLPNQPPPRPQSDSTSLPPLVSLGDSAYRNAEPQHSFQPSTMPEMQSCRSCDDLRPVIRELAIAVAELDETVQSRYRKSITRTHDYPREGSLRMVRWVLDRLELTKGDIQVVEPWMYANRRESQQMPYGMHATPPDASTPGASKRPLDAIDFAHMPAKKRRRSGSLGDQYVQSSSVSAGQEDHRIRTEYASRERAVGYSPPPTDSLPGSAHPHQHSPGLQGRSFRPLPSPSSVAYPPTVASSVVGPAPPSVSSPSTSYHPGSSIHAVSTSPAASQHIADLQHQVTLKSLSLQTLQTEYSGLLQKFQRERTKTQAIEKKGTVADKELNDLINKNEDLTEQVKGLETQVEELEKKRDTEREAAAREKEQYGRMLDMGGRLNTKAAEERRKLSEEKAQLEIRVQAYEKQNEARFQHLKSTFSERLDAPCKSSPSREHDNSTSPATELDRTSSPGHGPILATLQKENGILRTRVQVLRTALEETDRSAVMYRQEESRLRGRFSEMTDNVKRALRDEDTLAAPLKSPSKHLTGPTERDQSRPPPNRPSEPTQIVSIAPARPSPSIPTTSSGPGTQGFIATLPSQAEMAQHGRARSPRPADLNPDAQIPKSSPEEIIKALGPVPAPLPMWHPPPPRAPSAASAAKRTASGPLTPFPGTESAIWRSYTVDTAPEPGFSQNSPSSGESSLHSSPGGSTKKTEASAHGLRDWSPVQASSGAQHSQAATPMPPPPKPGAVYTPVTSWRPS